MSNNLEHLLFSCDSILGNNLKISILKADCAELEKGSSKRKETEKEITKLELENNSTWSKLPYEINNLQSLGIYIDKIREQDKQPNRQVDFKDHYKSPPELDQKQSEQQQEKQPTHHIPESRQHRPVNFENGDKPSEKVQKEPTPLRDTLDAIQGKNQITHHEAERERSVRSYLDRFKDAIKHHQQNKDQNKDKSKDKER